MCYESEERSCLTFKTNSQQRGKSMADTVRRHLDSVTLNWSQLSSRDNIVVHSTELRTELL